MIFILLDVLKWISAAILSILLLVIIAEGFDYFIEGTCIQETANFVISKFGYNGFFWKGEL